MLTHLRVQDLAVVDDVALDLDAGMTALTGETGAGKSLLVDALQLAVGARASAEMVRAGARSAQVTAVFEPPVSVTRWLEEQALDEEDGACVLRRAIGADGRSRAFINARPVPVSQLRELGEQLVDVHGQHSQQALLASPAQRMLVDTQLDDPQARETVAAEHGRLARIQAEIAGIAGDAQDPLARLDYLVFQVEELRSAPVSSEALESVEAEHRTLAHAQELIEAVSVAMAALDDGAGGPGAALGALEAGAAIDPRLEEACTVLRQAQALLDEARSTLNGYAGSLESDDRRLGELDAILGKVHDLARKHRVSERELGARLQEYEREIDQIQSSAARLDAATRERDEALARFGTAAATLSRQRAAAARRLVAAVNDVLATLGMAGAELDVQVQFDGSAAPAAHGRDRVTFLARTNPGQEFRPLSRVASGGELSRIALAVHAVALDDTGADTVIFDEADAGVGGAVAEIIGQRMRELGRHRQVLTVTHLPQVAAHAHHHAVVNKVVKGDASRSRVRQLAHAEREQELARMLGGIEVTSRTLDHAREMLAAAGTDPRRPAA